MTVLVIAIFSIQIITLQLLIFLIASQIAVLLNLQTRLVAVETSMRKPGINAEDAKMNTIASKNNHANLGETEHESIIKDEENNVEEVSDWSLSSVLSNSKHATMASLDGDLGPDSNISPEPSSLSSTHEAKLLDQLIASDRRTMELVALLVDFVGDQNKRIDLIHTSLDRVDEKVDMAWDCLLVIDAENGDEFEEGLRCGYGTDYSDLEVVTSTDDESDGL